MTRFDQQRVEQRHPRTWMPAEACSEFGVAAPRRRIPSLDRFAHWMRGIGRWLSTRHSGPHG
jgi:hypothetical protein